MEINDEKVLQEIIESRQVRIRLATSDFYYFAHIYFSEFIRCSTADFQREIYGLLADKDVNYLAIVAFRGSGKSTIANLMYPIWAMLGPLNKKFVLILSLNQAQARNHLQNIKRQFEGNDLLRKDFGPLEEESDEWGAMSLVFPKYGARISAASAEQSIRGIRHGAYRPDLIIADDVEDTGSVKTMEGRNKTHEWFTGEVLPAGDVNTKIVVVGNLLHEDSLMMRIKDGIDSGAADGVFKAYPLLDSKNVCIWPGKYPNQASIEREMRKLNNPIAWHREYLLKILPTSEQVVYREWLRFYNEMPEKNRNHPNNINYRYYGTYLGIDLAISEKDTADYTAMVAVHVFGIQEGLKIYVDPLIVNARLTSLKTMDKIEEVVNTLGDKYSVQLIVEDVAYQRSIIEQLKNKNYRVEPFQVQGSDKRSRLMSVSHLFEAQRVFMPNSSSKELVDQLVGFGVERHDDMVDALVMALAKVISQDKPIGTYGDDFKPPINHRRRPFLGFGEPYEPFDWNKQF